MAHLQGIQNRFGLLFVILLFQSLLALSSLPLWREAQLLLFRERDAAAYGTPAFFAAKLLCDLVPLRLVPPLLFAVLTYPLVGLHAGSAAVAATFAGVLVLANVVAALVCMLLGAALPSMPVANLVRRCACRAMHQRRCYLKAT